MHSNKSSVADIINRRSIKQRRQSSISRRRNLHARHATSTMLLIIFFKLMDKYTPTKSKHIIIAILQSFKLSESKALDIYIHLKSHYKLWATSKQKWLTTHVTPLAPQFGGRHSPLDDGDPSLSDSLDIAADAQEAQETPDTPAFFLKSLEEKGSAPITGDDLKGFLDQLQAFIYNAKYTEEGAWLKEPDILMSLLRGDTQAFKMYLNYQVFPKYYQLFPPFIKWGAVSEAIRNRKYEDYPDYMLAYITYMKAKQEWEYSQGLITKADMQNFDEDSSLVQLARVSDTGATAVTRLRRNFAPGRKAIMFGNSTSIQ
jgi:hypothetical protein